METFYNLIKLLKKREKNINIWIILMYFVEMTTVTNLSINGFMMETIHDHISSRRQHYEMKAKDKSIKFYDNGKNF